MRTWTPRKSQEALSADLPGDTAIYQGNTPVESYRGCNCLPRSNHMTSCCDDFGLDVSQEYDCTWCGKKTHRLDLDFEVPLHLECSGLRVARMLMPHRRLTRAILGMFGIYIE
jgi:hypothetical protein